MKEYKFLKKISGYCQKILAFCNGIPRKIGDNETILRTIFSPANFNNKGELKSNFMRPQVSKVDEDDEKIRSNKLSATRFDYSSIEKCRRHARRHSSQPNREYWGFARFYHRDVKEPIVINNESYQCSIEPKPTWDNLAHVNIVLPFKESYEDGVPASPRLNKFLDELCERLKGLCRVFKDPDISSTEWQGETIEDHGAGTDSNETKNREYKYRRI